jgi:putative AlgH/UPF0301 family transcriptional regulator
VAGGGSPFNWHYGGHLQIGSYVGESFYVFSSGHQPLCHPNLFVLADSESRKTSSVVSMDEDLLATASNASKLRFFVGNAGWSPGQLENELVFDSWQILPATEEYSVRGGYRCYLAHALAAAPISGCR